MLCYVMLHTYPYLIPTDSIWSPLAPYCLAHRQAKRLLEGRKPKRATTPNGRERKRDQALRKRREKRERKGLSKPKEEEEDDEESSLLGLVAPF